jgi:hypothetical protein
MLDGVWVFFAVVLLASVWAVAHALHTRSGRELRRKPAINLGTRQPFDDVQ